MRTDPARSQYPSTPPAHRPRAIDNPEFRALWVAEALSIAGDQIAKVALAIMVYGRTRSTLWAALVYAMTFLPALAGGLGLAQLADRFPRRTLMVRAALVQASLVGLMAIPGMPLAVLCGLVFVVALVAAPASAAQHATTREISPRTTRAISGVRTCVASPPTPSWCWDSPAAGCWSPRSAPRGRLRWTR